MAFRPIEPKDDPSVRECTVAELKGVPDRHREWLADAILALGESDVPVAPDRILDQVEEVRHGVEVTFERFGKDEDVALLRILLTLPREWIRARARSVIGLHDQPGGELYARLLRYLIPIWRKKWRREDWTPILVRAWNDAYYGLPGPADDPDDSKTALKELLTAGLVVPEKAINGEQLGQTRWGQESSLGLPSSLTFWVRLIGATAIERSCVLLEESPADEVGPRALGILMAVRREFGFLRRTDTTGLVPALLHVVRFLERGLELRTDDLLYLGAYWSTVLQIETEAPELITDEDRRKAAKSVRDALGRFRRQAAVATSDPDESDADFAILHADAVRLLARLRGVWPALKTLLLILRALRTRVVGEDLSLVPEDGKPVAPPRWSWTGHEFMGLMHVFARREQKDDPELVAVREKFARFCLDRLRTKERGDVAPQAGSVRGEDMVEPDAAWRTCYIRAIQELRSNPGSRGHHVLHWSMKHDPDEGVREAARAAYGAMTKGSRISKRTSPRRLIFAALWWLRQAHLHTVGVEPDIENARRTRQQEVRQTTFDEIDK